MSGMMAAQILAAAIGTVAFSVLFAVPKQFYAFCGVCGGAGWLVYAALTRGTVSPAEAVFWATMAVIFLSRCFAVWNRCPVTLFLIPGIFPLVPGAGVYWTSYYIVTGELDKASATGFMALKTAAAIVLGIVIVFEIPQSVFRKITGKGKNRN